MNLRVASNFVDGEQPIRMRFIRRLIVKIIESRARRAYVRMERIASPVIGAWFNLDAYNIDAIKTTKYNRPPLIMLILPGALFALYASRLRDEFSHPSRHFTDDLSFYFSPLFLFLFPRIYAKTIANIGAHLECRLTANRNANCSERAGTMPR